MSRIKCLKWIARLFIDFWIHRSAEAQYFYSY